MPAGILISNVFVFLTFPAPLQFVQGSLICFPVPPQAEQVLTDVIAPKRDCCVTLSCPVPLHLLQVSACVPGFAPVP